MLYEEYKNEQHNNDDSLEYGAGKARQAYHRAENYLNNQPHTAPGAAGNLGETAGAQSAGAASGASAGTAAGTAAEGASAGAEAGAAAGTEVGAAAGQAAGTAAAASTEAGAEGGAMAAGAAAAPETAGISLAIAAAVGLVTGGVRSIKNEIKSVGEEGDFESDWGLEKAHPLRWGIFLIFIVGGVFFTSFSTLKDKITPGSLEDYEVTSYAYSIPEEDKGTVNKEFASVQLEEYSDESPLKNGFLAYIDGLNGISGTGVKDALNKCITEEIYGIVNDMNLYNFKQGVERVLTFDFWGIDYNNEKSKEYFFNQKWPYDLMQGDDFPLIGNVMSDKSGMAAYSPVYDDVNYAEFLAIMSQNPKFNWKNCKYEEFNEFIHSNDAMHLYYELKLKWVVHYECEVELAGSMMTLEYEQEFNSPEEAKEADKKIYTMDREYEATYYWCKADVKPFGLRELYRLAEVTPEDPHLDFEYHTNYEMLPYHEEMTRVYLRKEADIAGPSCEEERSEESTIYYDLLSSNGEATGRSAWCYFSDEETYNWQYFFEYDESKKYLQDESLLSNLEELRDMLANLPAGANVLDVMSYYLNQGWFKGVSRGDGSTDIGHYGCIDTSYMMIYQYLTGNKLSSADVARISQTYVSGDQFSGASFCADNGISVSANQTFSFNTIQSEIDKGNPLVLHIRGYWEYGGKVYHYSSKQHFLVVTGYTDEGITVCDPGSKSNTTGGAIPYEAFGSVGDLYLRTFSK